MIIYPFLLKHDNNNNYSQIAANLFCAPSIMLETSLFKFYLGAGVALNVPNFLTSSVFGLARVGIKPDYNSSIDISTRIPYYLNMSSNISPPLITLNYTVQF